MLKYKWYRLIRVIFGARSFVKYKDSNDATYVLVKGKDLDKVVERFTEDGFIEEWPIERINNG